MASKPKTPKQHFAHKHRALYHELTGLLTQLPPTVAITLKDDVITVAHQKQSYEVYQGYSYTEQEVRGLIALVHEQQEYCDFLDLLRRAAKSHIRVCRHHVVEGAMLTVPKRFRLPPDLSYIEQGVPLFFSRDSKEDTEALRQLLTALEAAAPAP